MSATPWTDLPAELLAAIAKRLNNVVGVLRSRAVCKPWRSSIPLPKSLPFSLHLPFPISTAIDLIHPDRTGFFSLSSTSFYLIEPLDPSSAPSGGAESYQAMLIRVEKMEKNGTTTHRLLNPFNGDQPIGFFPKLFPESLNLLDYRMTHVADSYNMRFTDCSGEEVPPITRVYTQFSDDENRELAAVEVTRVVLFPIPDEDHFLIIGIYNHGRLFFMRSGEERWSLVDDGGGGGGRNAQFRDIAVYNGRCYAVDNSGSITVFSLSSSVKCVDVISSPVTADTGQKYLVESFGDLFLVHGDLEPPVEPGWILYFDASNKTYFDTEGRYKLRFKVYKLNEEVGIWNEVKSLEDRALFLGEDCRFSVAAKDFAGCRGNCIYYKDDWQTIDRVYDDSLRPLRYYDIGLFSFDVGDGGPLVTSRSYADIFWPPPVWLKPDPLALVEEHEHGEDPPPPLDEEP